jgi:hypothetical protein
MPRYVPGYDVYTVRFYAAPIGPCVRPAQDRKPTSNRDKTKQGKSFPILSVSRSASWCDQSLRLCGEDPSRRLACLYGITGIVGEMATENGYCRRRFWLGPKEPPSHLRSLSIVKSARSLRTEMLP